MTTRQMLESLENVEARIGRRDGPLVIYRANHESEDAALKRATPEGRGRNGIVILITRFRSACSACGKDCTGNFENLAPH